MPVLKMETLVLIPQDLSLALTPGGARGREAQVSVWTSSEIQRGTLLYPFQGTIRIDKLHVYSYIPDHDVSTCKSIVCFISQQEVKCQKARSIKSEVEAFTICSTFISQVFLCFRVLFFIIFFFDNVSCIMKLQ